MDLATVFQVISIAGFSLAGILFVAAIFMFIKLNIPAVIGDLSGKTAEKQIKAIRESNSGTSEKRHKAGQINLGRGKTGETSEKPSQKSSKVNIEYNPHVQKTPEAKGNTEKTSQTGEVFGNSTDVLDYGMNSEVQNKDLLSEPHSKETELLVQETGSLDSQEVQEYSNPTETLSEDMEESEASGGTSVLSSEEVVKEFAKEHKSQEKAGVFQIIRDITIVHTDEEIL